MRPTACRVLLCAGALAWGLCVSTVALAQDAPQPTTDKPAGEERPDLLFSRAQGLLQDDRPGEALVFFDELAARYPENVDYALGRAQALARLGRHDAALQEAERGIALAPDYEAVWQLHFNLLSSEPSLASDAVWRKQQNAARRRFPDATWWNRPRAREERGSVTLVLGVDELSGDRSSWQNQALRVDWSARSTTDVFIDVARHRRFANRDVSVSAGLREALTDRWHAGVEVQFADDATFLPESGLAAYAGRKIGDNWVAELRAARRNYRSATVSIWSATAERYFGDFRAAYTLNTARLHGLSTSLSHVLAADWYATSRLTAGLTLAAGDEAEAVGPDQVLESDVRAIVARLQYRVNARVTVRGWIGTHDQGDFYRRHYAGLAVTAGF